MAKSGFARVSVWLARWQWGRAARQALPTGSLGDLPVPAELFSADQMEQHGTALAGRHALRDRPGPDQLLPKLADNQQALLAACTVLTAALQANRRIAPAGEWLLDNFYLIEDQIRIATRHLPKGYSRELPQLAQGPSAGLPRVYDLALEVISHADGRMDLEGLNGFVAAYQRVKSLDLGELWAIPIMLRLALIDNLRQVAERVAASAADKERAAAWADWMMGVAERDPKSLILVVADMARSNPPMATAFVAELARRLQGQSAALALPLTWIEQRLGESGLTIEQLVQLEARKQAAGQVSISNCIASLRLFAAMDWREFVEGMSAVEAALRTDPAGIYPAMDFATRDHYRHVVERLARQAAVTEVAVAREAVGCASRAAATLQHTTAFDAGQVQRRTHVGYYLIGAGRADLEHAIAMPVTLVRRLAAWSGRVRLPLYLAAIGVLALGLSGLALLGQRAALAPGWPFALLVVLVFGAACQLAIALTNWVATLVSTARALPRLDFSQGIPADCRTLVVVPAMLSSPDMVASLCEALEVRFLANRDRQLQFALLTDFQDAPSETLPGDALLLAGAQAAIEALNARYGWHDQDVFLLLHRARRWNPQEDCWMGEERKRGKLAELNALLRGRSAQGFALVVGRSFAPASVRYVITLDSDTRLPRDTASELVGAMAHPLNHPHFDPVLQRVTEGYGILQPRVAVSLPSTNRSRYARIFGSESGIDPYTRAVSDVYQDVFGEGSFIGKGIYDVDAFEQSLGTRLPANRILSHDLLEGCYARAGLLSDVLLFEESPSSYLADFTRRYRWMRGDWQIAAWVFGRVPAPVTEICPGAGRNPLSALSRWKILDNLRRSVTPALLVLLLLSGWTWLDAPWRWTLVVLAVLGLPALLALLVDVVVKPVELTWRPHLLAAFGSAGDRLLQLGFVLACLLHEACFGLDAVARTTWRLLVSKRRLLDWKASAAVQWLPRNALQANLHLLWPCSLLAFALLAGMVVLAPAGLSAAAPVLLLWGLLPLLSWWFGAPLTRRTVPLSPEQRRFLRLMARRTWQFFLRTVGPADHWLPPDNYQEYPAVVLAHRTSPTNLGFALLANLAAYDLGYLEAGALLRRTEAALTTMAGLARHGGHFYNWYDTQTLQALPPLYVSTVDSGNLAASLLTLRVGLLALPAAPLLGARWRAGLRDTLDAFESLPEGVTPAMAAMLRTFRAQLALLEQAGDAPLQALHLALQELLALVLPVHLAEAADAPALVAEWLGALLDQCQGLVHECETFVPWLGRRPPTEALALVLASLAVPTLAQLAGSQADWLAPLDPVGQDAFAPAERAWLTRLRTDGLAGRAAAARRLAQVQALAEQLDTMTVLDYDFLYDPVRRLLSIGYNVTERRQDASYYDLLASEARLASFIAIAQGRLPQEHWFALGRLLTRAVGEPVLLSWSGSMFEYLMPLLMMPSYRNSLLDRTCRTVVERQIEYGNQRKLPWGISESGYNAVDTAFNYQYRAFGVPGLGLKPGLADDLVIAPYASALALLVAPDRACQNLQRLVADGDSGCYGFYEAVDFTPGRQPPRQAGTIVRSFMVHHQGMVLLALDSVLVGRPMQRRFNADPMVRATTLLLQERVPRQAEGQLHLGEFSALRNAITLPEVPVRTMATPNTAAPEVQLLSNGRYQVMVTNAGGGYSRWNELAVTRWREDPTCDGWGTFCYLRDVASGVFWSNAHQPALRRAAHYEAIFAEGRAEFRRTDLEYETHTEIVVSPEDDVELRRLHVTNCSRHAREIEVTSYAEVLLASPLSDALHPAFSNLFVQTEIVARPEAILATRRPRAEDEAAPWMVHLMVMRSGDSGPVSCETDRARFLGRGRSLAAPAALADCITLSGTAGPVLDPIVAIRRRILLKSQQTIVLDIVSGVAGSRAEALELAVKYRDRRLADRVFDLSWTHSQVVLRQINATEADAQRYSAVASAVLYAQPDLRAAPALLERNRRGQSGLWAYAISGDLPMVLVRIADPVNIDLVRQLVQAHAYWRLKGLAVDLVIWNEDQAGYRQQLNEQIMGLIAAGIEAHAVDKAGGIFVRRSDQMSEEERTLVQSAARAVFCDWLGSLDEQVGRRNAALLVNPYANLARLVPTRSGRAASGPDADPQRPQEDGPSPVLQFDNGLGGFSADGREYVITTTAKRQTPAPWVNVLANAGFGTLISESGMATTWSENAQQFRLSPWSNDPVADAGGEAFYLRDEETGHFWSPTPLPCRGAAPYVTRHGFGYSSFSHVEGGIQSLLTVYVALEDSIRFSVLEIRNLSGRPRRISAISYVEWVLGDLRPKGAMHIVTEIDAASNALLARNAFNSDFPGRVAFLDVDDGGRSVTGDRTEFIGRNRTLRDPAALGRTRLSGRVGPAFDPCGAVQVLIDLPVAAHHEWVFRLGAASDLGQARILLARWRGRPAARQALQAVHAFWLHTLGQVQVETPDAALDVLVNGWLLYQTLACRLWARNGFYQSGGAFGFRDQLQDVMALMDATPELARAHLLRCAARQFPEGDVQHWWHASSGRGVRTQCSDDFLWLPLATCRYVTLTGDLSVLDERSSFLLGRPLAAGEESYFDLPGQSEERATLYEHCLGAVRHGLRFGVHGLPLIGSGDWNDGMNRVGVEGRGESVWLAFFLYRVLTDFAALAHRRGDAAVSAECLAAATALCDRTDAGSWDGQWYRRAYFDDGTPLGSSGNAECRIDAVAQSWSALSGAAPVEHARMAMDAVDRLLVRRDQRLIALLTPPFDHARPSPGYIQGYLPGVRENGGQYTHAAIWTVMAFAALGDRQRAWDLFNLINPVRHGDTAAAIAVYKIEPYVVAADLYSAAPHSGRGGWSWYTGSAAWMYRLIVESLLGLQRDGKRLLLKPSLPPTWNRMRIDYRHGAALYHITVLRSGLHHGEEGLIIDGVLVPGDVLTLADGAGEHWVELRVNDDGFR